MSEDQVRELLAALFGCAPEDIDGYIILADMGHGFYTHQHNVNRRWILTSALRAFEQMEPPEV